MNPNNDNPSSLAHHEMHREDQPTENDAPRDWRELGGRIMGEALRRTMRDMRFRNGCVLRHAGRVRDGGGRL